MLKGKATIELTNVKTGEVERYEEENMITNAVQDILNFNPLLMKNASNSYYWGRDTILPLCPKLLGGVLLYKDPLEENPENYYASYTNELIGYSSNDVNTTTDISRGSMNQTESKVINNEEGYKFVFDFGTSQANGLISSLALTSLWGGKEGYGSSAERGMYRFRQGYTLSSTRYTSNENKKSLSNVCCLNFEQNYIYTAYLSNQNTITVEKYQMPFTKLNITTNDIIEKRLSHFTINTTNFGTTSGVYLTFFSDKNEQIWGFDQIGKSGNNSGNAILNWIKINPVTQEFEEGTWELPITIQSIGYNYNGWTTNNKYYRMNYSLLYEDYFYCFSYDKLKIHRINIYDPTDIKTYMFNDGSTVWPSFYTSDYAYCTFQVLGNVIVFPGGYICNDKLYKATLYNNSSYREYGLYQHMSPNLKYGPFSFMVGKYTDTSTYSPFFGFCLMAPYLATINNLETPIEKTEDKTMKITYILTEVEDDEEI